MRSILAAFASDLAIVEACDCASAASVAAEDPGLDLALLCPSASDKDATRAIAGLRAGKADLKIILVAAQVTAEEVMSAFASGARGYVVETVLPQVFVQAVRLVMSGDVYIPKEFLANDTRTLAGPQASRQGNAIRTAISMGHKCHAALLTPKQSQVLELMAQGKSNKHIGRELRLAPGTVKAHVSGILKALNVSNRTQAALAAGGALGMATLATHAAHGSHVN